MRYEILGSIRLADESEVFDLSAQKAGTLLVTLLIRANSIVPTDRLFQELWGGEPPSRPSASVHVYVSQLRKRIRRLRSATSTIDTRAPGYALELESDEIDFGLFEAMVATGRQRLREGRPAAAVAAFETALAYWRGEPLGGLHGGPILAGFKPLLEESRLECLELLVQAYLASERPEEAVDVLYRLIRDHPRREHFYELLMQALHQVRRSAEALHVYDRAREVLSRDLGLEPCRSLRELHQAICAESTGCDAADALRPPPLAALHR